jgi:hypothetical protein
MAAPRAHDLRLGQQAAERIGQADREEIAVAGKPVGMVVAHAGSVPGAPMLA